MEADVGVGMADEALVVGDLDAAEGHGAAGAEGVHVEAVARANVHGRSRHGARPLEIGRGGYLEVRLVAGDDARRRPGGDGDGDVVEGVVAVGPVGGEDRGETETLRRLGAPEAAPVDGLATRPSPRQSASTTGSAGKARRHGVERVEHGGDHVERDEGSRRVVDEHAVGGVGGERLEPGEDASARVAPPATGGPRRGSAMPRTAAA